MKSEVVYHCLFEQSGTFKNIIRQNGSEAYDYDILDDFNETDYKVDLFKEIEKFANGEQSLLATFAGGVVIAFFPCTRFETRIRLNMLGENYSMRNWSDERKLKNSLKLHKEMSWMYELVVYLALAAYKIGFKLIIENPYQKDHHLTLYFPIKPKIIDYDRASHGDYYKKPTQFWFINCEPKNKLVMSSMNLNRYRIDEGIKGFNEKVSRSMIHPSYAEWFLKSYVLEENDERRMNE